MLHPVAPRSGTIIMSTPGRKDTDMSSRRTGDMSSAIVAARPGTMPPCPRRAPRMSMSPQEPAAAGQLPPSGRRQMDAASGRRLSFTQTRPGRERGSMKITGAVLEEIGRPRPFAESKPISISELELAAPGPTEILVRMEAAGICHSDLSVVDGNRVRPVPMLLGHEAAGRVVEVGSDVDGPAARPARGHVLPAPLRELRELRRGRPAALHRRLQEQQRRNPAARLQAPEPRRRARPPPPGRLRIRHPRRGGPRFRRAGGRRHPRRHRRGPGLRRADRRRRRAQRGPAPARRTAS